MKKPKAVQASSAETTSSRLGSQQLSYASGMKERLITGVNKAAQRDDSNVLRSNANAGSSEATMNAVSEAADPMQRALAVSGGVDARGRALSDSNITARGSMLDRMSGAISLGFGAQESTVSSLGRLASAQNNAAMTVADANMRNTAATMGALGNVVSTYAGEKRHMQTANAFAKQNALDANSSATEYEGFNILGKAKTYKIGG